MRFESGPVRDLTWRHPSRRHAVYVLLQHLTYGGPAAAHELGPPDGDDGDEGNAANDRNAYGQPDPAESPANK